MFDADARGMYAFREANNVMAIRKRPLQPGLDGAESVPDDLQPKQS